MQLACASIGEIEREMKIDCHMHVNGRRPRWGWDDDDRIIEAADKLGIDQLCVSIPVTHGMPTMDDVCECNDDVLDAMRRYPGRILGYCSANEELIEQVRPYRDRLLPFATLNPTYAGWEEDLRRCAEDLELRGIRLYPQYHGYQLADAAGLELIDAATELGWVVQVPMRVVDRRQRHAWDLAQDLKPADIEAALALRPQTRWMVLNGLGLDGERLGADAQFLVEISRMTSVLQRSIPALIETVGARHLAFGTGMPFKVPEPALLKLQVLDALEEAKEQIAWQNAAQMLDLEV
jgi:predicted TIM-barrel fold metal-dependent hydrolase